MASAYRCSGTDLVPTRGSRQNHGKHQSELTPEPCLLDAIIQVDHAAKSIFVGSLQGHSAADARSFRICCRAARDLLDSVLTSPVKRCVAGGGRKRGEEAENRAAWSAAAAAAVDALRVTARRWPRRAELRLHLSGAWDGGLGWYVCQHAWCAQARASLAPTRARWTQLLPHGTAGRGAIPALLEYRCSHPAPATSKSSTLVHVHTALWSPRFPPTVPPAAAFPVYLVEVDAALSEAAAEGLRLPGVTSLSLSLEQQEDHEGSSEGSKKDWEREDFSVSTSCMRHRGIPGSADQGRTVYTCMGTPFNHVPLEHGTEVHMSALATGAVDSQANLHGTVTAAVCLPA